MIIPVGSSFYWLHVAIAIFGIFTLLYGLFAYVYKNKLFLSEVVLATVLGIILGGFVSSYIDPLVDWSDHFDIFLELTKIVIGLQLMATGLELTPSYLFSSWRSLLVLLFPVLILSWLLSSLFIFAFFFDTLNYWECLLIAACITPTDPVIASAIVKGKFSEKYIPESVRNLIEAESGANDGLALPFFYLPLIFLSSSYSGGVVEKIGLNWIVEVWLYQVILMSVLGLIAGGIFGMLAIIADWKKSVDKESYFGFNLALTALVLGGVELLGGDSILAVFFSGISFSWSGRYRDKLRITEVNDAVDLITTFFFILLGTILPFDKWADIGVGRLIGMSTVLLIFKRLPFVVLFKPITPEIRTWKNSVFVGWFGPVGVAGLFYSLVAYDELDDEKYFNFVTFIIFFSVLVHGMTAAPFSKLLRFFSRRHAALKRRKGRGEEGRSRKSLRSRLRLRRIKREDQEASSSKGEKDTTYDDVEEAMDEFDTQSREHEEERAKEEHHDKTYSESDVQQFERRRKMKEFVASLKREKREKREQETAAAGEPPKAKKTKKRGRQRRDSTTARELGVEEDVYEIDNIFQFMRTLWMLLRREGLVDHNSARADDDRGDTNRAFSSSSSSSRRDGGSSEASKALPDPGEEETQQDGEIEEDEDDDSEEVRNGHREEDDSLEEDEMDRYRTQAGDEEEKEKEEEEEEEKEEEEEEDKGKRKER